MALVENKRTDSIRVRLSPDMMERFERIGAGFGMPVATLAAFAIADFVQRQESSEKMARMALLDATRTAVGQLDLDKALEAALPAIVQALSQQNLPLDGEATAEGA